MIQRSTSLNCLIDFIFSLYHNLQPRGREKTLASAGHVQSLIIPEKLIYMQPAFALQPGFALTEVERSNSGK